MANEKRHPETAPRYSLHRTLVGANDVAANLTKKPDGVNCQGRRFLHVQVIPDAGAGECNPTAEVKFWSEERGLFISQHTALSFAGLGVGIAYEFTVEVHSRVAIVSITAGMVASKKVQIFVSSSELSNL